MECQCSCGFKRNRQNYYILTTLTLTTKNSAEWEPLNPQLSSDSHSQQYSHSLYSLKLHSLIYLHRFTYSARTPSDTDTHTLRLIVHYFTRFLATISQFVRIYLLYSYLVTTNNLHMQFTIHDSAGAQTETYFEVDMFVGSKIPPISHLKILLVVRASLYAIQIPYFVQS